MAVDRKYERDIDLLLAEEFVVSTAFATWVLSRTRFSGLDAKTVDVYVSRSDATGESDLVVIFEEGGGKQRFALLIEDKIDAVLQPNQEARYRVRGMREIERGDYQSFEVLLFAPQAYIAAHPEVASFDQVVTYEEIAEFLRGCGPDLRLQYRANFVSTAAKRNANTWSRVDDEVTNAFWHAAYQEAVQRFPILELKPLTLTKDSTWITVRPSDFPTKPIWTYVSFKGDRGSIDLTFTGTALPVFAPLVEPLIQPQMSMHQTGKSAAIRISVTGFNTSDPLADALPKVRKAFEAAAELITFYRENRQALSAAAITASVTPPPPPAGARAGRS